MSQGSKSLTLDKTDLKKVAVGTAIAAAGGIAAYFSDTIIPFLQNTAVDGDGKVILAVILSVAVNLFRKWVQDNKE